MKDIATLSIADFKPLIGEGFAVPTTKGTLPLTLREATQMGQSIRDGGAFSLVFEGAQDAIIEQQLCPLTHEGLGEMTLFLVPIGPFGKGLGYEAVFT